ncbi:hypothetical protein NDA13_005834 [Ustilago tritici]|nr:hypothetical protein NDA13_005834 [Ustilago tritici]
MSLLNDLASSTSALIWGPPAAPAAKDPPPQPAKRASISKPLSPPPTPSRKAILLKSNLGLGNPKKETMATGEQITKSKLEELPLPPPPEEETSKTASSVLLDTGTSALSLLGSAVMDIGSAAVSALSSAPSDTTGSAAKPETPSKNASKDEQVKEAPPETFLGSISNAVLGRAASVRDAAIDSVTGAASSLVSSAAHAITGTATGLATSITGASPSPPSPANDADPKQLRRASTLPIQYTATGEPFSPNPSISAMQRIPDHPCGNAHNHRTPLAHCCSAPDVLTTVEEDECTCKCHALAPDSAKDENGKSKEEECKCVCHSRTAYNKGESGHFHRVEQLVKGTKRVVRDIKNVL